MENKKVSTSGNMTFHFLISFFIYDYILGFVDSLCKNILTEFFKNNADLNSQFLTWILILVTVVLTAIAIILSVKSLFRKSTINKSETENLLTNIVMFFIIITGIFMFLTYKTTGLLLSMAVPAAKYIGGLLIVIVYVKKYIIKHSI